MDLKLKDIADMLKVSEKTVYRWVNDNLIPYYRINRQYRFNREEIKAWLLTSRIAQSTSYDRTAVSSAGKDTVDIVNCIRQGGIYYRIAGRGVEEVISNAVSLLRLPVELDRETVVYQLLQREAMISTGMGDGIAIPHPRVPLLSDITHESISICFLEQKIDFRALDKVPVYVMFIILSANQRRHLEMLSKISYLCHQSRFRELLSRQALRQDIIDCIDEEQQHWIT